MDGTNLTKSEKRELAKKEKSQTRSKERVISRVKNFSTAIAIIVVVVGGLWYLNSSGNSASGDLTDTFVSYAEELSLDKEKFKKDLEERSYSSKIDADVASGKARNINSTPSFLLNGQIINNPRSFEDFSALISGAVQGGAGDDNGVLENDIIKGSESAQVTLIEYADFQCPACASYAPIIERLLEEYPDDLKVVFRHYPLVSIHKNAYSASLATEAAAAQGKFWEMHNLLFEKQSDWANL